MRLSTSTILSSTTNSTNSAYETYLNILTKISSGSNYSKMSENPTDCAKILKLKDQISQVEVYQSNITAATNEMDLAYDTLGDITDELSAISSLVTEAANGTTTTSSAQAIASEIEERVATIVDKMNTKYLDNYIFSGTYTQTVPYTTDEDGNIVYNGSSAEAGSRNLTISENTTFSYNITGEEIFGSSDFFSEMQDLIELLNADELDYDAIREKLDTTEAATNSITKAQGKISAYVSKLDSNYDSNTTKLTTLTEDLSNLEDVDLIQASTDLASAQSALEASYQVYALILESVSLLDYL